MPSRAAAVRTWSVDVVIVTPAGTQLSVLLRQVGTGRVARWELPWTRGVMGESLDATAVRVVRGAVRAPPALWLEQAGAYADQKRHPGNVALSVTFAATVPAGAPPLAETAWFPVAGLPPLQPRHRAMVNGALDTIATRLDQTPVAFRLLPPLFTLSELQHVYELLLGRRLHKASFRRALQAAHLVEPTEEWRAEGRGRPAQLFRYAPRRRRGSHRAVRFDLLRV